MRNDRDRLETVLRFGRMCTRHVHMMSGKGGSHPWSLNEGRLIRELFEAGTDGTTGSQLAEALALDPGYVSRLLRRLRKKGLTSTTPSSTDGRRVMVRLTPDGMRAHEQLREAARADASALLARVDPTMREDVITSITTLERALGGRATPSRIRYRAHRPGDMGWIVQRHAEIYQESHGWDATFEAMVADICVRFLTRYDPARERSWIAEADGRRAGAIALMRRSRRVAQLRLLFVEPWARGLGIGGRLVSECVGQARHFGYHRMILFTVAGLDSARRLYEAEGFRLTSEEPGHAWGKDHRAQTWELTL